MEIMRYLYLDRSFFFNTFIFSQNYYKKTSSLYIHRGMNYHIIWCENQILVFDILIKILQIFIVSGGLL